MHWPVRIFYVVLTVLHAVEATSSASHDQGPGLAVNWNDHSMRRSAAGGGNTPTESVHCADPMNTKSMSLIQRGDSYTGTLRIHDTLGMCP